ncbi:MAG: mevalonate kinase, partial [Chloroflexi bacterium]|nr:mevalonate kinase [Chloroflexota bacterium]
ARALIELGQSSTLGGLMLKNQELLKMIGVSSTQIEILVDAAMGAGAEGAKLSGAGRGGNVIALVTQESKEQVTRALMDAGAVRVIVTEVGSR